ncbi:MAG: hypothetical protein WB424_07520 [Terracidiphilus sp.]
MFTGFCITIFWLYWATIDLAYRFGLSKNGSQTDKVRDSIETDFLTISVLIGALISFATIRLAGIENDLARIFILLAGCGVGLLVLGWIGMHTITRFFGVKLKDASSNL